VGKGIRETPSKHSCPVCAAPQLSEGAEEDKKSQKKMSLKAQKATREND
jgi:hypothetical protein